MRAGRLDRFITIQRKSDVISDGGGVTQTWTTIAARRAASYAPIRGDERFAAPERMAEQQVEFRIRYSSSVAGLSELDRLIYPALAADSPEPEPDPKSIYDIVTVFEIGRREGLQIIAMRRPDVTA